MIGSWKTGWLLNSLNYPTSFQQQGGNKRYFRLSDKPLTVPIYNACTSDACTLNILLALALALTSVINNGHKWCHSLECHLLMTLESSFIIVICLKYRPLMSVSTLSINWDSLLEFSCWNNSISDFCSIILRIRLAG